MGQQQLLLIILGVMVVGLAVAVGIAMFLDNTESANRDAIAGDLLHLASKARHYYYRPISLGGGNRTFEGLTADDEGMAKLVSTSFSHNANGRYTIKTAGNDTLVVFRAIGTVILDQSTSEDDKYPIVEIDVYAKGQSLRVIN